MEIILSVCIGIGLAAACGFRIFVPMLVLSVAAYSGHVQLASAFQWIGTEPALIAFSVATLLEVLAYYIPWVDNLMDTAAAPVAVVAGTVVTAAVLTDMSPFMQWTLAVIAGGGVAGLMQAGTTATRAVSAATSGGLANPLVSTAELGVAGILSFLAVVLPFAAALIVIGLIGFVGVKVCRRLTRPPQPPPLPAVDSKAG